MTARKRMFEAYGVIGEPTLRDTYAKYGLPTEFDEIVQTGVIVFSPEHHRQILEKVYFEHEGIKEWEMFPLSYELLKANAVQWIDERFNWVWGKQMAFYYPFLMQKATDFFLMNLTKRLLRKIGVAEYRLNPVESLCVTASFKNSYFFHFAGHTHAINLVDWKDFYR